MSTFTYTSLPARALFGTGALQQVRAEVERLGAARALVLSTPGQAATRCWASARRACSRRR